MFAPALAGAATVLAVMVVGSPSAWALVANGTQVTQADQSTSTIESLAVGDTVLAWDGGWAASPVTNVVMGQESNPVYYVEYLVNGEDSEFTVATADQPFITSAGATPARNLVVGDELRTIDGTATITGVSAGALNGTVFGIAVNESTLDSADDPSGHVVLTNGVQAGDLALERALQHEHALNSTGSVDARLPSGWATDYSYVQKSRSAHRSSYEDIEATVALSTPSRAGHAKLARHLACLVKRATELEAANPTGRWQGDLPLATCSRPVSFRVTDDAAADSDGHIHLNVACPDGYRVTDITPTSLGATGRAHALRLTERAVHIAASPAAPGSALQATAMCRLPG